MAVLLNDKESWQEATVSAQRDFKVYQAKQLALVEGLELELRELRAGNLALMTEQGLIASASATLEEQCQAREQGLRDEIAKYSTTIVQLQLQLQSVREALADKSSQDAEFEGLGKRLAVKESEVVLCAARERASLPTPTTTKQDQFILSTPCSPARFSPRSSPSRASSRRFRRSSPRPSAGYAIWILYR